MRQFWFSGRWGKTTHRGVALEKNSSLKQENYTLLAANFKHFDFFSPEHLEKIHFHIPTIERIHSLDNSLLETKP